ncbi:hypothetical protein N9N67_05720 [Bacteriovoracaceae bacterium]|nr:hypothetical protein [Bacteriovoracaceae bacterium]
MQKIDTINFNLEVSKNFSFKKYYFSCALLAIIGIGLIIYDFEGNIEGLEIGKIVDLKNTVKIKYPNQINWRERKLKLLNNSLIYIGKDSKLVMNIEGSIITLDNEESLFRLSKNNDNFSFDIKFGSIKVTTKKDNIIINNQRVKKNIERVIRKGRVYRESELHLNKPIVKPIVRENIIEKPMIKKFSDIIWSQNKKKVNVQFANLKVPVNEFQLQISGDKNFIKKNDFTLNDNPYVISIKRHGKYFLRIIDLNKEIIDMKKIYIEKEQIIMPDYLVYPGDKDKVFLDKDRMNVQLIVDQVNPQVKNEPKIKIELSEEITFANVFFSKKIIRNSMKLSLKKELNGEKEVFLRLVGRDNEKVYHSSSFYLTYQKDEILKPERINNSVTQEKLATADNPNTISTPKPEVLKNAAGPSVKQEALNVEKTKEIIKKPAPKLKKRTKVKYFVR